uniref:Saposin B-type domain-containing protein n=2 Tax=Strongyloides stercoralis TaxID=6248 RepID=A0AAF5DHC0_STRER
FLFFKSNMKYIAVAFIFFLIINVTYSGWRCTFCMEAVKLLEQYLVRNEGKIDGAVDYICDRLVGALGSIDGFCKLFLNQEIDKLIQGIKNNEPPNVEVKPSPVTFLSKVVHFFKRILSFLCRHDHLQNRVCHEILLKNNTVDNEVCRKIEGKDHNNVLTMIPHNFGAVKEIKRSGLITGKSPNKGPDSTSHPDGISIEAILVLVLAKSFKISPYGSRNGGLKLKPKIASIIRENFFVSSISLTKGILNCWHCIVRSTFKIIYQHSNKMKFLAIFFSLFLLVNVASASFKCTLCLDVVKELEQYLASHEGNIDGAADYICDKVTGGISILDQLCKSLLTDEIDQLIQGIENKEPPQRICEKVHFC